jgi:hypothetical protein
LLRSECGLSILLAVSFETFPIEKISAFSLSLFGVSAVNNFFSPQGAEMAKPQHRGKVSFLTARGIKP